MINNNKKGLVRNFSIVGIWTTISQFLGIARDVVLTSFIGPGIILDTFILAMKVLYSFKLFISDSLPRAFIPVMSEYINRFGKKGSEDLTGHAFGALIALLSIIVIFVLIFSPLFLIFLSDGNSLNSIETSLSVDLLRITFPFLFFVSLASLAGSILNVYEEFFIPSFTPIFYNLLIILTAVWIGPFFQIPIYAISWGVLLSGLLQFLIHILALNKRRLIPKLKFNIRHPGVIKIIYAIIPVAVIGGIYNIFLLMASLITAFLAAGNTSWFYISERVMSLPLDAFAMAIAVIILPRLSILYNSNNLSEFSKTLDWSFRLTLLIGIPSTIGLMSLSEPIIMTLFERDEFQNTDTKQTASSLFILSLGLSSFMLIKVTTPVFFAMKLFSEALITCFFCILVNLFLLAYLVLSLDLGNLGIAISCTFSGYLTIFLLLRILVKNNTYTPEKGWIKFLVRLAGASLILFIIINNLNDPVLYWRELDNKIRIWNLIFIIIGGILSYTASLWALGMRLHHINK